MILIYCDKINPRIEYIFRLIFCTILQKDIIFTIKSNKFLKSDLPKINYSYERFGDEFYIKPHRFLHSRALIQPDIKPVWYEGEKFFFESSTDSTLPFDIFSASFYVVSRYEEYLNFNKDQHKRFPAEESILEKYGLLKKPVVNIWAQLVASKLKEKYPDFEKPKPKFSFLPTIDIDNAWAYAHKGLLRNLGAISKAVLNRQFPEVRDRLAVLLGKQKDPYDTYEFLNKVFQGNEDKVIFFFLLGDYNRYDKNIFWKNKHFQNLVRNIASRYKTGIHPSYSSAKKKNKAKLARETSRLQKITGKEVKLSRQHFLKLRIPRMYRNLLKIGIELDFSMGYPSHPGFRAGICTPFPFYDLKKELATSLMVMPFQVMDVTLNHYMNLSPQQTIGEIIQLMQEVKNVGGTFSYIWHNETLNDKGRWKGYRNVFEVMNETGFKWMEVEE